MSLYTINNTIKYNEYNLFDITKRFIISKTIKNNPALFLEYSIQGNETPADVAQDFYSDPTLYWLIFLMNDIIDPFYGWVLSDYELNKFIDDKYGLGNGSNIHHGTITNLVYETTINDSKRKINIIRPDKIKDVMEMVKKSYE